MLVLLQRSNALCVCMSHKCHNLSPLNSCDDIFIIELCLIEKDKENSNADVELIT